MSIDYRHDHHRRIGLSARIHPGAVFVTLLPIVIRILMENIGSLFFTGPRWRMYLRPAAGRVRRPDHLFPGSSSPRGSIDWWRNIPSYFRFGPSLIEWGVAAKRKEEPMTRFVRVGWGSRRLHCDLGVRRRPGLSAEGTVFVAVRPDRSDGHRGRKPVPRLSRLHRPGEQQRAVSRASRSRSSRSTTSTRCRPRWRRTNVSRSEGVLEGLFGTASTMALTKKLEEDKIRHVAWLRHGVGRWRASPHLPDRGQLLVTGGRRWRSPRRGWAAT